MEYYIQTRLGETYIAGITNNDEMIHLTVARDNKKSLVGAIYVGRVIEVNKTQSLAVVDLGKINAVLNNVGKLQEGDTVLVQVLRDGIKEKMPMVNTRLILENRYFIISSTGKGLSFGRGIGQGKVKTELEKIVYKAVDSDNGVTVKASAKGFDDAELKKSYESLRKEFNDITSYEKKNVEKLRDAQTPLETCVYNAPNSTVYISDNMDVVHELKEIKKSSPDMIVKEFKDGDLFDEAGLNDVIENSLLRTVNLDGGGDIVIDECEAITAIDVNVGSAQSMNKGDEALFKLNKRAAKQVARHISLRNLSGLIVVDFVRLKNHGMAKQLPKVLTSALREFDPNGTWDVMDFTKSGLVEITRKRTRPSLSEIVQVPLKDRAKNSESVCLEILQSVLNLNGAGKPTVYAPKNIITMLEKGEMAEMRKACEDRIKKDITFEIDDTIYTEMKR